MPVAALGGAEGADANKSNAEDWNFEAATMDRHYDRIFISINQHIDATQRRREGYKWPSRILRGLALLSAVGGILLPLVVGKGKLVECSVGGVELGYIAFAIGGLILLADQVFACSSSWSRLRMAELQLVSIRDELELDWAKQRPLLSSAAEQTDHAHQLLDLLKVSQTKAHIVNEMQMKTWVSELSEGQAAVANKVGKP